MSACRASHACGGLCMTARGAGSALGNQDFSENEHRECPERLWNHGQNGRPLPIVVRDNPRAFSSLTSGFVSGRGMPAASVFESVFERLFVSLARVRAELSDVKTHDGWRLNPLWHGCAAFFAMLNVFEAVDAAGRTFNGFRFRWFTTTTIGIARPAHWIAFLVC